MDTEKCDEIWLGEVPIVKDNNEKEIVPEVERLIENDIEMKEAIDMIESIENEVPGTDDRDKVLYDIEVGIHRVISGSVEN